MMSFGSLEGTYKSFDELPMMLNADQVSQALGISRAGAYQLMHTKGFPTLKIGKRMVVAKEKLLVWIEKNTGVNQEVW